jgi:hypothetical protein
VQNSSSTIDASDRTVDARDVEPSVESVIRDLIRRPRRPSVRHCFLALAAGLVDPFNGVFSTLLGIFRRSTLPADADTPQRRRHGLVIVLGGIEGPSRYNRTMARSILDAGFRGAVIRCDWNKGVPIVRSFVNLMHRGHQERQSNGVVAIVEDHASAHPGSPVFILAQSGGCWIAVRTLEKLHSPGIVDACVFLAPSISPGSDLRAALANCRHGIVAVGGAGDMIFLGLGTLVFGTSDRVHAPAAGWVGWRRPPPPLFEVRWRPEWIRLGYWGNHTTTSAPDFLREKIAPVFIRAAEQRRKSP